MEEPFFVEINSFSPTYRKHRADNKREENHTECRRCWHACRFARLPNPTLPSPKLRFPYRQISCIDHAAAVGIALTQGGADAEAALPSQEIRAVNIEVLIEVGISSRPGHRKDLSVQKIYDVQVSRAILTERYNAVDVTVAGVELAGPVGKFGKRISAGSERPDPFVDKVSEEVGAMQSANGTSIHISSGGRVPFVQRDAMTIVVERVDVRSGPGTSDGTANRRRRRDRSFPQPPTIVFATQTRGTLIVYFFTRIFTVVGNVQVARRPIEARTKRIAQSVGPDFVIARLVDKRDCSGPTQFVAL